MTSTHAWPDRADTLRTPTLCTTAQASATPPLESRLQEATIPSISALVQFTRPHTIIGTVLAVVALWVMALHPTDLELTAGLPDLLLALLAALATNVYIVGVNQVTDVEIDRINKPELPIAAGTLTMTVAKGVVAGSAVLALVLAAVLGPFLLAAVVVGLAVGSAYSLPPLRLKRYHVAAAAAITSVRALAVNLLVFAHFADVLVGQPSMPRHIVALTGMVLGLTIAIAWFKDIPDAAGDAAHGIGTLVLHLGVRRVMAIGLGVLGACYVSLIGAGIVGLPGVNGPVLAAGHALLLAGMVAITARVDPEDIEALKRFYRNIWRLFFAEYVVFTAAVVW